MKVKIQQQQQSGILSLPEDFAILEKIVDNSKCVYRVFYQVNPTAASQNRAYRVAITALKTPAIVPPVKTFVGPLVVENLLLRNSLLKDATRSQEKKQPDLVSDITAWISNESTRTLTSGMPAKTVKKKVEAVDVKSLEERNIEAPLLASMPLVPTVAISKPSYKRSSMDLLMNLGIDPSVAATRSHIAITPVALFGGTRKSLAPVVSLADNFTAVVSSLAQVVVPVVTTTTVSHVSAEEVLRLPLDLDDFTLEFKLLDNNNSTVEKLTRLVEHGKNVSILLTPKLPPVVNTPVSNKPGRTVLDIMQTDPIATGVRIYRKSVSYNNQTVTPYVFAGLIPLTIEDGNKRFEDLFPNYSPVIYRVVPVGRTGELASEFAGVVGKSDPRYGLPTKIKNNSVSISTTMETGGGIRVELGTMPAGSVAVELWRTDMSMASPSTVLAGRATLTATDKDSTVFVDTNVHQGRMYRYFCKFWNKEGSSVVGSSAALVEYQPETSNIADTQIAGLTVTDLDDGTTEAKFNMLTSLVTTNEDKIKQALEQQGLSRFYNDNITKDNLQNLVAYKITRANLTTGELEEFGVTTETKFSDRTMGEVKGASPLRAGEDYRYTVSTHFRPAETMLDEYTKQVTYADQPLKNYTYKPSRWLHPVTLDNGNLVTTKTLQANYSKDEFTFGKVGKISTVDVLLSKTLPAVFQATAVKVNSRFVKLQWKLRGNTAAIDHFTVVLEVLGQRMVVGKCHGLSDTGQFQFIDSLDNGERGLLTYYIIPIYHDFTMGTEVKTNEVRV